MKIGICYRDSILREHIQQIVEHIDFVGLMPDITGNKEVSEVRKYEQ